MAICPKIKGPDPEPVMFLLGTVLWSEEFIREPLLTYGPVEPCTQSPYLCPAPSPDVSSAQVRKLQKQELLSSSNLQAQRAIKNWSSKNDHPGYLMQLLLALEEREIIFLFYACW